MQTCHLFNCLIFAVFFSGDLKIYTLTQTAAEDFKHKQLKFILMFHKYSKLPFMSPRPVSVEKITGQTLSKTISKKLIRRNFHGIKKIK